LPDIFGSVEIGACRVNALRDRDTHDRHRKV